MSRRLRVGWNAGSGSVFRSCHAHAHCHAATPQHRLYVPHLRGARDLGLLCLRLHATSAPERTTGAIGQQAAALLSACKGRAALAERRAEVAEFHTRAVKLGTEGLVSNLGVRELCDVCSLLAAAGYTIEARLLEATARLLQDALAATVSRNAETKDVLELVARLALAACEADHEKGLGADLVEVLCAAGAAGCNFDRHLSGTGAAALALAAAAAGRADMQLFDALVTRCSAQELDLNLASLGNLRLASVLSGRHILDGLDTRAASFLRTVCSDVPLDDPRGIVKLQNDVAREEHNTPFESEVSDTLHACEVPHSKGSFISGVFVPFTSHSLRAAFCTEEAGVGTAYANAPAQRSAWQRWRCRSVAAAGWRVIVVAEAEWRKLVGVDERVAHMRHVLLNPLDIQKL